MISSGLFLVPTPPGARLRKTRLQVNQANVRLLPGQGTLLGDLTFPLAEGKQSSETSSMRRRKANVVQRRLKSKDIKSAGAVKKRASKTRERSELLTTERLCEIWEEVRSDTDARRALERLDQAGFRISHLTPQDASFKHPSWADYVAALPLLPNELTTRRIHPKTSFRKYWPLVRELREFAANVNAPFVELKIYGARDYPIPVIRTLQEDLLKAASMLEHFLSWDWSVRHLNPRNAVIAELR
jgi:hypothetical protein